MPSRYFSGTGTPITGSGVTEASIPGRWAAPPAPAMMTSIPRSWARLPKLIIWSGMRWADTTPTSAAMSNSDSASTAADMTG